MSKVLLQGLQIRCDAVGSVTIPRNDFVIGRKEDWPKMYYTVVCPCGETHRIPMKEPPVKVLRSVIGVDY